MSDGRRISSGYGPVFFAFWFAFPVILVGIASLATAQQVELISRAASPLETAGGSSMTTPPSMSDDGRFIVFVSRAENLVVGQNDTNAGDDVFLFDRLSGTTTLVSHGASATTAGSSFSAEPAISANGAYVVFTSNAPDLGPGFVDTNGATDIFLYEIATGAISLVSHTSSSTTAGNSYSNQTAISADGNWIVFSSQATDLGSGFTDVNAGSDVFLYERATGNITLVSHASSPTTCGNDFSSFPVVNGDGGWVAFMSRATDLGSGITDLASNIDIFLYDRSSGNVSLVSHTSSSTTAANGPSSSPVISRDGAYVAFDSVASDLGSGLNDLNSTNDVFLYERTTANLTLVSHTSSATTTGNFDSSNPEISGDGSQVAFLSNASNLGPGFTDTNGTQDIFLYHRATGNIDLVTHASSTTTAGNGFSYDVRLSGDGNYVLVTSVSSDLGSSLTDSNAAGDVFLYETATGNLTLVSHTMTATTAGNQGSELIAIGWDGAYVAFQSYASDLGPGFADASMTDDVFYFERATGNIGLVSRATGSPSVSADGTSLTLFHFSMSGDGRFVVFTSTADNLVPGQVDLNHTTNVFLYDRSAGTVSLVSHTSSLVTAGNGDSPAAVISRDGNWIAFESSSNDLGTGLNDSNSGSDVYLYERTTGNLSVVSHTSSAITTGTGFSMAPSISADGRYVAFHGGAPNLGPGFSDTNSTDDVFVYDRSSGNIALVSHTSTATTAGNGASRNAIVSGDGAYVIFQSSASNLGTGISDSNSRQDVFLYDVGSGAITLVSHSASPTTTANNTSDVSAIAYDGSRVLFESLATNLGSGFTDSNSAYDLFLFDRATSAITLVSHTAVSATTTGNGASVDADLSDDGNFVAFPSSATNLSAGVTDSNSLFDIFLYDQATGNIALVSHSTSPGATGNASSDSAAISRDGARVAFRSSATDLISGYVGTSGVFLFDRLSGVNSLVSHVASSLTTSGNGYSDRPVMGMDGAHVAFSSTATDLVDPDLNVDEDAFLFSFNCGATSLTATPNGNNRIDLVWTAPGAYTYQVLRSRTPGGPYDTIGTVTGTSFVDANAEGGITYYYVVANACGPSNEASAATVGACQLPPDFAGATSAIQLGSASCAIEVDWALATAACGGGVSYTVYRDTSSGFVPDPSNRLVTALPGSPYDDAAGIVPATTYYYIVRATSDVNGEEDDNLVEVSVTPSGCTASPPAPVTFFDVRSGDSENVLDWVNPTGTFLQTHIAYTDDGSTPSCTGTPVPGSPFAGVGGDRGRIAHSVVNGTTYRYAACAEGAGAGLSAPHYSFGRPDTTAGNWKWAYTTGAAALSVSGVLPNSSYYVVSNDRVLHGLDPGVNGGSWPLGPPEWFPFPTNGPVQGRPLVVELPLTTVAGASRIAIIGSQDGRVYAVDAESGAQLWASPVLGAAVQASPAAIFQDFGGSYDLVLVGIREPAGDSRFYALHLANGAIAWTFDNGGGSSAIGIISSQAQVDYVNDRVYFASRRKGGGSSDTVWCLGFTDSTVNRLWSVDAGEVDGSPVLAGTRLYVGNNLGEVHALNPTNGSPLWASPFTTGDGPVKGFVWPDVANNRLYFSTSNEVHAIHDDGGSASPFWSSPVSIPNASPLLLRGGRVYVGGGASRLYSVDATSPTPAAPTSVILGDPGVSKVVGAPTLDVVSGLIIVGSDLGVIFAVAIPF